MNKKIYSELDPLYTIQKGYNEDTRMLSFLAQEIEADKLQEALDIIEEYNSFESKLVGKVLLEYFGRGDYQFMVGREGSPVVYVVGKSHTAFWLETMNKIAKKCFVDEVSVDMQGRLRLWWD